MPLRKELLEILVCPVTKEPLEMLSDERLAKLNERIAQGNVQNVKGAKVDSPLDEGLVTADGKTVYRVDDGIPVLLAEEGIATEQFGGL